MNNENNSVSTPLYDNHRNIGDDTYRINLYTR